MDKREAHRLLDLARAGGEVSEDQIRLALWTTGDLSRSIRLLEQGGVKDSQGVVNEGQASGRTGPDVMVSGPGRVR